MLRVSMRTDYSVRAAIELAARFGHPPASSSEIAAAQDIPEPYLDQLLVALRKAGLVRSSRGPQGGHTLVRSPREVTLADVIIALDGRQTPLACMNENGQCQLGPTCPQREPWLELDRLVWDYLKSYTLTDLLDIQTNAQARAMYHI